MTLAEHKALVEALKAAYDERREDLAKAQEALDIVRKELEFLRRVEDAAIRIHTAAFDASDAAYHAWMDALEAPLHDLPEKRVFSPVPGEA